MVSATSGSLDSDAVGAAVRWWNALDRGWKATILGVATVCLHLVAG
jgi:hypothetical protein